MSETARDGSMRAQRLTGPRQFELGVVPRPAAESLDDGEVLVRVEAGGICGSDMPFYRGSIPQVPGFSNSSGAPAPGLPLHEIVGEVIAERGSGLTVGARIVGWATSVDGMSEFIRTRGSSVIEIDGSLPAELAVALQPLACVIHAVDRIPASALTTVTILGLGPIGSLFAHVLRSRGATRIRGVDCVDRSGLVERHDLDEVVWSTARAFADRCRSERGARADLVIEAIGHQSGTLLDAVDALSDGGTIFYFGIVDDEYCTISFAELARRNGTIMTGFTPEAARRGALAAAVDYVRRHPDVLTDYVTHVLPLTEAGSAFELAANPRPGQGKVVVRLRERAEVDE